VNTRALVVLSFLAISSAAVAQNFRIDPDRAHFDSATLALPVRITVTNTSAAPLAAVQLSMSSGLLRSASGPGWDCTQGLTSCNLDHPLAAGETAFVDAKVLFGREPARVYIDGNLSWTNAAGQRTSIYERSPLGIYRTFVVTQSSDGGAGSLREAIGALNADPICASDPCGIEFQIAATGAEKWQTIHVRSQLPPLTGADVTIDGDSQTAFAGDTNADGPEIELRGDGVAGDGLELRSSFGEVQGLAIGGFGGNGLVMTVPPREYAQFRFVRNYLGTDPTGSNAVPNGLRGMSITGGYVTGEIRENVLSGNGRSGLWVWTEQSPGLSLVASMEITRNRVGVQAHADTPLPNGASGLFFGPTTDGAAVETNVIEFNRDFGVAIARGTRIVRVRGNVIAHNGVAGIDAGLDGPNTQSPTTLPFNELPVPIVTSATWNAATSTTTIVATSTGSTSPGFISYELDFYANDSREHGEYAEGQHFLGTAARGASSDQVTLTVPGDLRGQFITALTFRTVNLDGSLLYDTGELSKAIEVR
jgi:hypothetical protein